MTLDTFLREYGRDLGGDLSLLGLAIVFLGGLVASAVCPCTLPVGLGMASVAGASEIEAKRGGLKVAAAFFAGIVVNLTLLGALAGRLGALLTEGFGRYWTLGMAILSLVAAGFAFFGPRLKVSQLAGWRRPGLAGAFGYGFIFSLGTSVAPLLLLLTVAAAKGSSAHGLALAFTFGLGRGFPFLLAGTAATAIGRFTPLGGWQRTIQVASGWALLLVSGYYVSAFTALQ